MTDSDTATPSTSSSNWLLGDSRTNLTAVDVEGTAMAIKITKDVGIPRRPFGRHADEISIIGLGGYHLGTARTVTESIRIVHEAIDAGINFFDNAWEYHDGESERRMGRALADRRHSVFLMTKVCTHGRDQKVAMRQLEESLRRLRTDHLDLWQIHECAYDDDPDRHFARGGVVEAHLRGTTNILKRVLIHASGFNLG